MISPRAEVLATSVAEHGGRFGGAERPVVHDFSVSLNAFGPADVVSRAIAASRSDEYPDPRSFVARQAAADRWHRPIDEIVFGAGAAEMIHAACFAFLRPGDHVLIRAPAFGEYARAASLCGARVDSFGSLDDGCTVDHIVDAILTSRPRLVFLATPASPCGDALSIADIRRVADSCSDAGALLVLDQAYDAFTATPLGTPALPGHSSVLHVRSLTKDHALAGARVAFAVTPPAIADAIERVRVPWSASTAAQAAGAAAMTHDAIAHVARTTALLRAEASRIALECSAIGRRVRLSSTHYLLVRFSSARQARDRLLTESGILVRDCTSFGLPQWIRVAARTPAENNALIAAFARNHHD